jgi:hypothetical protein
MRQESEPLFHGSDSSWVTFLNLLPGLSAVMRQRQLNGLLEVTLHRSSLGWRVDSCCEEQQEELNADPKKAGGP